MKNPFWPRGRAASPHNAQFLYLRFPALSAKVNIIYLQKSGPLIHICFFRQRTKYKKRCVIQNGKKGHTADWRSETHSLYGPQMTNVIMLIHEQFSHRRVPIFSYLSFIILILYENENCALDHFFSLSIETHVGRKAQQEPATINNKSAVQFYAL